jgi:CubicO group peptidase (beta-lactamase class C family)
MRLACRKGLVAGCASVVLRRGELVQAKAFGFADLEVQRPFRLDSICRVYCVTKTYVTVLFMMLVEQGRARLEDPVSQYIPAFANVEVVGGAKPKRVMRIKHLLKHTSGLGYGAGFGAKASSETEKSYARLTDALDKGRICSLEDFTNRLAKVPLRFHPGDRYEYGYSTDVLGRVCEVITGMPLSMCLQERLFAPLGMHDTGFAVPDEKLPRLAALYANQTTWNNLYGKSSGKRPCISKPGLVRVDGNRPEESAWRKGQESKVISGGGFMGRNEGGLVSTVADTSRFVRMLVRRGVGWNGHRVLKEETLAMMEEQQLDPALAKEEKQCMFGALGGFSGEEFGWGGAACTYWSLDRKAENAIVWFTQHLDMPEWEDQKIVAAAKADIWTVLHKGV